MRLERLEVSGFKSFSDRTQVTFPPGITAVVGPNGCGKSNIGDALNWVLGEQSAKMLRGKQMTDVIFAGSEKRKPLGMAEVTLHFGDAEGIPSSDHGKVSITRRLFRSGESDYLINGKRSRLKDIQDILEHGRVGARSYATIEQGRIDQILNAKPKERRVLIEDAAGISGYKHKRRLTELKLEATHANLLRVNDILVEVERQIRSLKRQAGKARRYRELREELREKEQLHFGLKALDLDASLQKLREEENKVVDREAEAAAGLSRQEISLVDERSALEAESEAYRASAEQLHQLELTADRAENQIKACAEKMAESVGAAERQEAEALRLREARGEQQKVAESRQAELDAFVTTFDALDGRFNVQQAALVEAERRLTEGRQQLESFRRQQFDSMNRAAETRNRLRSTEEALARNKAQGERLESEQGTARDDLTALTDRRERLSLNLAELSARIDALRLSKQQSEAELQASRVEIDESGRLLGRARESEKSIVGRLHTLEDVATRFAGVSDGVRTLLSEGPAKGLNTRGVVADFLRAGEDIESIAEGYLGDFLPTVILESDADLEQASELLRQAGAGRTSLVSRTARVGAPAVGVNSDLPGQEIPPQLLSDSRTLGRLRDRLDLQTSINGVLADRVGDAILVDTLTTALEWHQKHPYVDYLTQQGDIVYTSGVVATGGVDNHENGLLAHRRRMEEARVEAAQATEQVAAAQTRDDAARQRIAAAEAADRGFAEELTGAERRHVELGLQVQHASEEKERTDKRSSVLADEIATLGDERIQLEATREQLAGEVDVVQAAHLELEEKLKSITDATQTDDAESRRLGDVVGSLREERAALGERRESLEGDATRLRRSLEELDQRVEALGAEATGARQRGEQADQLKQQTEEALVGYLTERETMVKANEASEQTIAERRQKLSSEEGALKGARETLETLREATRDAQLARTRAESDREHLDEMCRNELEMTAAEAADAVGQEAIEETDREALGTAVREIKGKIERLGPVNMTAIEEFSELEERHGFLTSQKEDLETAMAKLRETIRKINKTSRELFVEAFTAIRASYQEVFKVLFNGGRADLVLEEGEDVLDCGIEIMVQPPGKRLGSVQLMSGGEKALSAVALLFSIFQFQPSPFCLLDEVDAPLDDTNVTRFARLLQEYAKQTQFIIVTHNKLSMEVADLLYGVTMEEPGVSKVMSLQLQ